MSQIIGCYQTSARADNINELFGDLFGEANNNANPSQSHIQQKKDLTSALACSTNHIAESEQYYVVVTGTPYWIDENLTQLAKQKNHAHAALRAYSQSGKKFLEQIRGPFTVAILDKNSNSILVAIDRVGINSLYYSSQSVTTGTVFGNRASSVLSFPGINRELNQQSVFDFIYFHMVPSPGSIYSGINKLQPGQFLELSEHGQKIDFYWQPSFEQKPQLSFPELQSELKSILDKSVRRCGISANTGAFLSGGLDSTTVVGFLSQASEQTAKTFSIGFDAKGFDEIEYARISAKHYNADITEYYVTPNDVSDAVPKIAKEYDEPFGNASAIPTYYCAKLAQSNGVNQLLAGDGGDELFAGNARYAQQKIFELYSVIPKSLRTGLLEPLTNAVPFGDKLFPVRKLRSYIAQANIPLPKRFETYNYLERTPLNEIFNSDFISNINPLAPVANLDEVYNRTQSDDTLDKMLFLDWKFTLADNDLRKVNQMCHFAGIDVRYPMLDDELVEFCQSIPSSTKLKGNQLRYFYKNALADFLPPQTLTKSKHGFGLPFGVWLKKDANLQALAYDNLSAMKKRSFFHPTFIDRLIEEHRHGHANFFGDMIWVVMMLELWLSTHGL